MNAAQASIYQKLEDLLDWVGPVIDRLPKTPTLQELGKKAVQDILNSMDLFTFAFKTQRGQDRLPYIDALIVHMTDLKTIIRYIRRLSKRKEPRVITEQQFAMFINLMNPISAEVGRWRASNAGDCPPGSSDRRK